MYSRAELWAVYEAAVARDLAEHSAASRAARRAAWDALVCALPTSA